MRITQVRGRVVLTLLLALVSPFANAASEEEKAVERSYVTAPPAPERQTAEGMAAKSAGCLSCHTASDQASMHTNPAVKLGCTDCHGGNTKVIWSGTGDKKSKAYALSRDR